MIVRRRPVGGGRGRCPSDRAPGPTQTDLLTAARIVVPDFLGNRAPHADPAATGVVSGLTLDAGFDDLLGTYVAAVLGVGYGLRQILEVQRAHDVCPRAVVLSGGAGQSQTIKQMLADACGLPVLALGCEEPVLLGAAMLGAVASGDFGDLRTAIAQMSSFARSFEPSEGATTQRLRVRFAAFEVMQGADRMFRQALA